MKSTKTHTSQRVPAAVASLPSGYLTLLGEFPLRPIQNGAEYDRAEMIIHRLALREDDLDQGERAYLEVLENLVEKFDHEHHAFDTDDVSPTDVLRTLFAQSGMTVSELGRLLGSKGAASELLSGKRKEPSKSQITKLCERFKVDARLFLASKRTRANAA